MPGRFAEHWIDVQREEFKRLGVTGEWDDPYLTMSYDAEAVIAEEFMKFVMNGSLYQGSKPVMWSVVEKTALAEAEVEYHEHQSHTIWVKFPVVHADPAPRVGMRMATMSELSIRTADFLGAHVVIWTTTPWTIPQNRAICFNRGPVLWTVPRHRDARGVLGQGRRPLPGCGQAGSGRFRERAGWKRTATSAFSDVTSGRVGSADLRSPVPGCGRRRMASGTLTFPCCPATTSPTMQAQASSIPPRQPRRG